MRNDERSGVTRALLLTALCMAMLPVSGWSQAFPVKPVRIVTAEPGGGNEIAARILAQELTQAFFDANARFRGGSEAQNNP